MSITDIAADRIETLRRHIRTSGWTELEDEGCPTRFKFIRMAADGREWWIAITVSPKSGLLRGGAVGRTSPTLGRFEATRQSFDNTVPNKNGILQNWLYGFFTNGKPPVTLTTPPLEPILDPVAAREAQRRVVADEAGAALLPDFSMITLSPEQEAANDDFDAMERAMRVFARASYVLDNREIVAWRDGWAGVDRPRDPAGLGKVWAAARMAKELTA